MEIHSEVKHSKSARNYRLFAFLFVFLGLIGLAGLLWFAVKRDILDLSAISRLFEREETIEATQSDPGVLCVSLDVSDTAAIYAETWKKKERSDMEFRRFSGEAAEECTLVVSTEDRQKDTGGQSDLVWRKYYGVMVDYGSPLREISHEELMTLLGTGSLETGGRQYSLIIGEDRDDIDRIAGLSVSVETVDDIATSLSENTQRIAVAPFDLFTPAVKEVDIADCSLTNRQNIETCPLVDEVWLSGDERGDLFSYLQEKLGEANYDPGKISTVVVTGTSVVGARGLYQQSTQRGDWLYAGREIAELLRSADIAHISNESSFADTCVQNSWTMVFCGPTAAFDLLTWAGIDVVGLTGNHILDAGVDWFNRTLELYTNANMKYFGGGRNATEAHTPAIVDTGQVSVAFLGYNMIPPAQYYAGPDAPGSAYLEESALRSDITAASENADFVFVDMQWGNEYERQPNSYQTQFGHIAVDAGADVVSGVHPHWVQPVEFYGDSLIFYSLGNFWFDQTWSLDTREGIMVRHYFYEKKYLGFEIFPTLLSDTYQPQFAQDAARERIEQHVFEGL